jgi:hypothetical protein
MSEDARRMLSALFSGYESPWGNGLRFEIRCRPGKGRTDQGRPPRSWWVLTQSEYSRAAAVAVRVGRTFDTYVGVLPRVGHSGQSEDCSSAAALWASVDDNGVANGAMNLLLTASKRLDLPLPAPHIAVASGGGIHCAWLLAGVADLFDKEARDRFQSTLRRISRSIGIHETGPSAEAKTSYLSYMLRVPGSHNHKSSYGAPRLVKLLRCEPSEPRRSLTWWRAHLPPEPLQRRVYQPAHESYLTRADGVPREMPPALAAMISAGTAPGTHHNVAVEIAAKAFAIGYRSEAVAAMLESFALRSGWKLEKNEIRFILRHFERKAVC